VLIVTPDYRRRPEELWLSCAVKLLTRKSKKYTSTIIQTHSSCIINLGRGSCSSTSGQQSSKIIKRGTSHFLTRTPHALPKQLDAKSNQIISLLAFLLGAFAVVHQGNLFFTSLSPWLWQSLALSIELCSFPLYERDSWSKNHVHMA